MASNPFIGHIMGTKVLKPLTALIWLLKYVFENKNNVLKTLLGIDVQKQVNLYQIFI